MPHLPDPEPLRPDVLARIAAEYPEPERAKVARVLPGYRVAPGNFGRLRLLDAACGRAADLLVAVGNTYGRAWVLSDTPDDAQP